ncbi:MAG: hypothetical protein M3R44_06740 [Candidatus Eremiobacteraeota bacterium]|nr:hypothetical protein [Candidatus Eremiobacteraeota bacterium]
MSAARALLGELIDDAGLFPPARLSMADALTAHERAQAGETYWMLGRFIVAASQLDELRAHLDDSPDPLPTSVVLDGEPSDGLEAAAAARGDRISVEAVEVRAALIGGASADALARFAARCGRVGLPATTLCYIELAVDDDPALALANLRDAGSAGRALCAKIRCGGVTAEARPDPGRLAAFIGAAKEHAVPFKATAGLHHPIAHDNVSAGFPMHGFLNVIGGAVLLHAGAIDGAGLEAMLRDEEPRHFHLDEQRFEWSGAAADAAAIGAARAAFVHSYGSCSFEEPIDDLCALGMLGETRSV